MLIIQNPGKSSSRKITEINFLQKPVHLVAPAFLPQTRTRILRRVHLRVRADFFHSICVWIGAIAAQLDILAKPARLPEIRLRMQIISDIMLSVVTVTVSRYNT